MYIKIIKYYTYIQLNIIIIRVKSNIRSISQMLSYENMKILVK